MRVASLRLSKMNSPNTKLPLCQGSIDNYKSISQRTWTAGCCISCTVHSYSDLGNSIYYCLTRTVSGSEFTFKVLKKKNSHFFQLHCHLMDYMTFRVMYDEDNPSVAIPSKETEYGYWTEVPIEIVYDPRNKFILEENSLVVHFYYDWGISFSRNPYSLCGKRMQRDEELFSQDMLKLYDIRNNTGDISIKVQGEHFILHKFVLDARTMWFKHNPKSFNWKEVSIKGEPLVMDKVVRYMYSGVLEETDQGSLLQMLDIAVTLEMRSLMQSVNTVLIKTMTKDNALKVLKTAKKLGLEELVNFAESYFPDGESSPETKRRRSKNHRKKRR